MATRKKITEPSASEDDSIPSVKESPSARTKNSATSRKTSPAKAKTKPSSASKSATAKASTKSVKATKPAGKKAASTSAKKTATSSTSAAKVATIRDGQALVVVESPAKAKTLQKYLGSDYLIEASVGHVVDLPTNKLGVDVEGGFEPEYVVMKGKEKVMDRLKKLAEGATRVYLAPDPDREGEAIAWHIQHFLREGGIETPIVRATFHEITKRAVEAGLAQPRDINSHLFEAQQARRILDRLVGYRISPLLWSKVFFGLSAGRVQSVAVRLIVDREKAILDFEPEEYWSIEADALAGNTNLTLRLAEVEGVKPELPKQSSAEAILSRLGLTHWEKTTEPLRNSSPKAPKDKILLNGPVEPQKWIVSSVEKKDTIRRPSPPFITSTLQQEASRKLGFGAQRTMSVAQKLYEGLELGKLGPTALITYMRTDSPRVSPEAVQSARDWVKATFGDKYIPEKPRAYTTKSAAQDAHEAIRPVDMSLDPEALRPYLDTDFLKLYTLIWNRFMASQMADALFESTRVETEPKSGLLFVVNGLVQKFPGFLAIYEEGKDDEQDEDNRRLPPLKAGDELSMRSLRAIQHFTAPPPRFTEATLVKELEKQGIGRPSTYAAIVGNIQDKKYVEKDDAKRLLPTDIGNVVTDLLKESFPDIMDLKFTAHMEERLDEVESGQEAWRGVLGEFWENFSKRLENASKTMRNVKKEAEQTDLLCNLCQKAYMVIKWGRNGRFLACPRYPECRNTAELSALTQGEVPKPEESGESCDLCGRPMVVKSGRTGRFLACTGYPECRGIKPFRIGVKCPKCETGQVVERVSKKGRTFYSCTNYSATPSCDFVEWNRPIPRACKNCGHSYMTVKTSSRGQTFVCPSCKFTEDAEDVSELAVPEKS